LSVSFGADSRYERASATGRGGVIRVRSDVSVDTLFERMERDIEDLDQVVVRGKGKARAGNADKAVPLACEILRRTEAMATLAAELRQAVVRAGLIQSLR
jgi:hypothetical protein